MTKDSAHPACPSPSKLLQLHTGIYFEVTGKMEILQYGCRLGQFLFFFYLGSMGYYLFVRITQTLDLRPLFLWYGILTLVIECFGSVSVIVYGVNHLW